MRFSRSVENVAGSCTGALIRCGPKNCTANGQPASTRKVVAATASAGASLARICAPRRTTASTPTNTRPAITLVASSSSLISNWAPPSTPSATPDCHAGRRRVSRISSTTSRNSGGTQAVARLRCSAACETTYGENAYTAPPTTGPTPSPVQRRIASHAVNPLSVMPSTTSTLNPKIGPPSFAGSQPIRPSNGIDGLHIRFTPAGAPICVVRNGLRPCAIACGVQPRYQIACS